MHSLLAAWRVSLHRTRADWPIVVAAWLVVLLAATLLAAGPIYSSSVSLAGLHRSLEDADVAGANVEVTARVVRDQAAVTLREVASDLEHASPQITTRVVAAGRSDSWALPGQPADAVRDLAILGFIEGVEEHATLLSGTWPATAAAPAPVQVVVGEQVAETLGLGPGDRQHLVSRLEPDRSIDIVIVGIYRSTDPSDPYWWGDPTLVDGVSESAQYRTFGPLLTTREALLGRVAGTSVPLTWHAYPDFARLTIDQIGPLRSDLEQLPATIEATAPGTFPVVRTSLGDILSAAERSLLVSRTGILLLMAQLAILAGYAIVLTAALIVDHRRLDTALLRSRGAGPLQIGGLALAEALLLAVPALVAGPWLAAGALRILNLGGPLAGIGLEIEPQVSVDAYLAAGVAAVGCALLLVLPALLAARSFASEQAGRSRFETRTFGQRLGLDAALLSLTVVAIWQLRLYGAPLTRTVHGALGLDPLLVAAPAIGLLAGGVVALRLLPLLAQLAEGVVSGGRYLVGSLGARQLARRPLRYTRASLLLMLAMSMGVFAVSYASTWAGSQRDQARFQVGADLRAVPASGPFALPAWGLSSAYGSVGGVRNSMPLERQGLRLQPSAGAGEVLALDPDAAPQVVQVRQDQASSSVATLVEPLIAARPTVSGIGVPGRPQRLLVMVEVPLHGLVTFAFDPETGTGIAVPVDPATLPGSTALRALVYVRDARGLVHRFASEPALLGGESPGGESPQIEVPLAGSTTRARESVAGAGATLSFPIEVLGADLAINLPGEVIATSGRLGLNGISASDAAEGEDWRPLELDGIPGWQIGWTQDPSFGVQFASGLEIDGRYVALGGDGAFSSLPGTDFFGRGVTVSFVPSQVSDQAATELAAVVNGAFLGQTAAHVGDLVSVPLDSGERDLRIVGTIGSFPTTDPGAPLAIVDLASLQLLRFQSIHSVRPPSEWWLAAPDEVATAVGASISSGPFAGASVTSWVERTASLSADPLALGITGALALGFVVAALFAVIGLAVSAAVSARQRRGEFALLRALGLSGGQLSGWLWLENASLVVVSLVAGTGLGLLIGWVVLPYVTVTQAAGAPFPPVIVETPWESILVLEAVTAAALALTVIALATILRRAGVGSVLRMGGD